MTLSRMNMYAENNRPFSDFELSGKYDTKSQKWTVTLKTNGENSGFQFSEHALYEAPADGYVKEMTLTLPVMPMENARGIVPEYIYARVREPGFYMRMQISTVFIDETRFVLQATGVLNPFGSRCLEELKIIDYEEVLKFEEAANNALLQHKFAEQYDYKKLIKDGKAKY